MTLQLDGALYKAMLCNAAAAIENNKNEINELNVFPVPDGDTGTNMSLTLANGMKMLAGEEPHTVSRAAEITASALLRGARGNSGVILSLLFRGMAKRLKDLETATAADLAAALREGVEAAYKAVMKPTEGTILTVSRLAADGAVAASETEADIEAVLEAALNAGNEALADTINQNPVLKKAGVIDSGGKGYIYILDGMLQALRGEIIEYSASVEARTAADFTDFDTGDITFAYCTEFIVDRTNNRDTNALRAFLDAHGDSIVVVDDDEIIKVHVHTNDPGIVLTEALTFGALLSVKIENMREQHTEKVIEGTLSNEADAAFSPASPEKKYGFVAVCAGEGLEAVFRDLGADMIITGGQTMNPSTEDILRAIEQTPAEVVFVYPNNSNIVWTAQQAAPLATRQVIVVPTKTMPQGVAAMLAFDLDSDTEDNTEALTSAATRVKTVLITHAARDSVFDGHDICEGEYLALLDSSLLATGPDFEAITDAIVSSLGDMSPEFITLFSGEDSNEDEAARLSEKLSAISGADVTVISGGQPVYRYMISAE